MTIKTALQWPLGFITRKDPFPQGGVRGTIGKNPSENVLSKPVLTERAIKAGVKPTDLIVKVAN